MRGVRPNGKARNHGVAQTTAPLLVFVDDDTLLGDEHVIANLVGPLLADPAIGVTGASKLLPPDAPRFQRWVAREVPRIVGGLNPERDLRLVLTAAKRLREIVRIQVRWRIIGPGEPSFVQALRDQVSRLGIEDVVTIEGEVPATLVPSILARATVGVVSYQRNPLTEIATPNKAYEYAVAGKAMVVADLPALRRLLGDTVRYYNPGNAEDLALNVQWLLEHPSERGLLELAARQRIAAHRWEIMADRLIRVYQECLATDGVFPRFEPGRENSSEPTWRPSDGR